MHRSTGIAWKFLNAIGDSTRVGDTVSVIASFTNANRKNDRLQWFIEKKDSLVKTVFDSSHFVCDTMRFCWHDTSEKKIFFAVTDKAAVTWWDSTSIHIVQDVPVAHPGKDTTVTINSSVRFLGTASLRFGTIVMNKWDFDGDGVYDDSSAASGAMTHIYTHEATYTAVFYVREDNGSEAKDSLKVMVVNSAPRITSIRNDTTISINDSIALFATATDTDGTIKEYAWSSTGDGVFEYTSPATISTGYRYTTVGVYHAILLVKDDDGKAAYDTAVITVLRDAPLADAGNDTIVFIDDKVHLHATATQQFGTIARWQWKIGSGDWTTTGGPDTSFSASSTEQTVNCSFAATDDDGNTVTDEMKISVILRVQSVSAGYLFSLILRSDSTLWGCGDGSRYGTSGSTTPKMIMGDVKNMDAGYAHCLILKNNGILWACGYNHYGQLGTGDTLYRGTPVQIMADVQNMSAGNFHSLILKNDGTLWGCGSTWDLTPILIMSDVKSMDAGNFHSLILKNDGTLWACGYNHDGQLGAGDTLSRNTPVQIMSDVQNMSAGDYHSLIVKTDGTLWTCGGNSRGQLCDGTKTPRTIPIQVMSGVRSVDAHCNRRSMILKADGTLWVCGNSVNFCMGDYIHTDDCQTYGDGAREGILTQIMNDVQGMAGAPDHYMVIKTNGELWACGSNFYGQLGNGTSSSALLPTPLVRIIPPQM
jgi:alpha-tubulin suppressor-like RCC1 family protein